MNKLTRTINPEVRIVDLNRGLVDYVASDETLDCYREIVKANGWKFTHFQKNAPFCNSHMYWSIEDQLGKVVDFKVEKKQLIERVQWAIDVEENAMARLGFKMTERGYLKAVSVGFFPTRCASPRDSDPKSFNDAISEMKLSPEDASKVRCIYLEQEQIELSACIIGANPNALAKAHHEGAVTDAEMAAIGFDDNGLDFLYRAAVRYPELDLVDRSRVERHLAIITRPQSTRPKNFLGKTSRQHASAADGPDAAAIARRRESDSEWLRKFKAACRL